jgi:hypothetical protein
MRRLCSAKGQGSVNYKLGTTRKEAVKGKNVTDKAAELSLCLATCRRGGGGGGKTLLILSFQVILFVCSLFNGAISNSGY